MYIGYNSVIKKKKKGDRQTLETLTNLIYSFVWRHHDFLPGANCPQGWRPSNEQHHHVLLVRLGLLGGIFF